MVWRSRYAVLLGVAGLAVVLALSLGLPERVTGQKKVPAKAPSFAEATGSPEQKGKPNRLVQEKSPYLLQHAYNPVDWYPWGEEAFQKARQEKKPIFLSVGYSTCHWCHVMERESFSDPDIAAVMNQHFVSIKVDREERPDVDQVYMTFIQATAGRGGWPMSVFLTPELKPFFGGTYFPPENFKTLLSRITEAWATDRTRILLSADQVTEALKNFRDASGDGDLQLEKDLLDRTYQWYVSVYDAKEGGFGQAPKFPRPVDFNFVLRYYARTGEKKAQQMVTHTLRQMAERIEFPGDGSDGQDPIKYWEAAQQILATAKREPDRIAQHKEIVISEVERLNLWDHYTEVSGEYKLSLIKALFEIEDPTVTDFFLGQCQHGSFVTEGLARIGRPDEMEPPEERSDRKGRSCIQATS